MLRCWRGKGLWLCEEAELEVKMVNLAQIPNVQFNTEPAFCKTPVACSYLRYFKFLFIVVISFFQFLISVSVNLQMLLLIYILKSQALHLKIYQLSVL